jgi:AraC-like DNA-binding protein
VVRVASLASVPGLLRDMGTDPVRLLESVGFEPRVFEDPENSIALVDAGRLLEACVQSTGCPHFGLLVGQRGGIVSLGMVGALMRHSPTVDAALRSLTLHMHLRTRGGVPTRTVEGKWATLGYALYQRGMPGSTCAYDVAIAIAFNIMRTLCGVDWLPSEVQFARAKPRDTSPYRRLFRSPLRFDADRTAIVFDRRWLDQPLPGCDAALHRFLQEQIAQREALDGEDLAERVRRALRTMLVTGRGAEQHVAELFSIHPRTLHRRLRAQGTSLRGLVEEGRCEIACQLLRDTNMSVSEIANVLDYADATALTRAFGRWMSCPPAAWRAKVRCVETKSRTASRRKTHR